jgi:hypothetical protein
MGASNHDNATMRGMRSLVVLIAVTGIAVVTLAAQPAPVPYDLILKNGRIVDGTGSPWFTGDVAIRGDAIARIAPSIAEPATRGAASPRRRRPPTTRARE